MRTLVWLLLMASGYAAENARPQDCSLGDLNGLRRDVVIRFSDACLKLDDANSDKAVVNAADLMRLRTAEKALIAGAKEQLKTIERCFASQADREVLRHGRESDAEWDVEQNPCGEPPQSVKGLATGMGVTLAAVELNPWQLKREGLTPPPGPKIKAKAKPEERSNPTAYQKVQQKTLDFADELYAEELGRLEGKNERQVTGTTPPPAVAPREPGARATTSPSRSMDRTVTPAAAKMRVTRWERDRQNSGVPAAVGTGQNTETTAASNAPGTSEKSQPNNEAQPPSNEGMSSAADRSLDSRYLPQYRLRPLLGYQSAGGSSQRSENNWFSDLYFNFPLPFATPDYRDCLYGPSASSAMRSENAPYRHAMNCDAEKWRLWGSVRLISAPETGSSGVIANVNGVSAGTIDKLGDSVEFLVGVEGRLKEWDRLKLSATSAFGVMTPARVGEEQAFVIPTSSNGNATATIDTPFRDWYREVFGRDATTDLAGRQYITFVNPDRSRFFRQVWAGVRVETKEFDHRPEYDWEHVDTTPRGTFDAMFGMNEAMSKGYLRGVSYRVDGYHPIPFLRQVELLRYLYLFGTAEGRFGKGVAIPHVVLKAADNTVDKTSAQVYQVVKPAANRDFYRFGVGIDALQVLKKLFSTAQEGTPGGTEKTPGAGGRTQ